MTASSGHVMFELLGCRCMRSAGGGAAWPRSTTTTSSGAQMRPLPWAAPAGEWARLPLPLVGQGRQAPAQRQGRQCGVCRVWVAVQPPSPCRPCKAECVVGHAKVECVVGHSKWSVLLATQSGVCCWPRKVEFPTLTRLLPSSPGCFLCPTSPRPLQLRAVAGCGPHPWPVPQLHHLWQQQPGGAGGV